MPIRSITIKIAQFQTHLTTSRVTFRRNRKITVPKVGIAFDGIPNRAQFTIVGKVNKCESLKGDFLRFDPVFVARYLSHRALG